MREIPQRELRNNVSAVLREVEAGESRRVTVRGRPVADLVPVAARKRGLSPEEVARIVAQAPLDLVSPPTSTRRPERRSVADPAARLVTHSGVTLGLR